VRTDEAQAAVDEWAAAAIKQTGAGLPASALGQIESVVPDRSQWAIADDARTFWALGADGVLRALALEAGRVRSWSRLLLGAQITVSHTTGLVEDYQDTETRQVHHWTFSLDGTRILALTGIVYGERGRPRDRPDRQQVLALALEEVTERLRP
jgi:hypothetical protein